MYAKFIVGLGAVLSPQLSKPMAHTNRITGRKNESSFLTALSRR
jgi:hypothetical protein